MCVLSIKMPIRKKSGNLFNGPHILDEGLELSVGIICAVVWVSVISSFHLVCGSV